MSILQRIDDAGAEGSTGAEGSGATRGSVVAGGSAWVIGAIASGSSVCQSDSIGSAGAGSLGCAGSSILGFASQEHRQSPVSRLPRQPSW